MFRIWNLTPVGMADLACTRGRDYLKAILKSQLHHLGVLKALSNIYDRVSFGEIVNSVKPLTILTGS